MSNGSAGDHGRGNALAVWLALSLLLLVLLLGLGLIYIAMSDHTLREGLLTTLTRAYGLVAAGVASFTVVAVLKQTYGGPLTFKGLGFEFQGASGPVIMWLICYLGIVFSFRLLAG